MLFKHCWLELAFVGKLSIGSLATFYRIHQHGPAPPINMADSVETERDRTR